VGLGGAPAQKLNQLVEAGPIRIGLALGDKLSVGAEDHTRIGFLEVELAERGLERNKG
jgi:hypothetical protein